jgi:hypothetical protein
MFQNIALIPLSFVVLGNISKVKKVSIFCNFYSMFLNCTYQMLPFEELYLFSPQNQLLNFEIDH